MSNMTMQEMVGWLDGASRSGHLPAETSAPLKSIAARLKALEEAIIGAPCEEDGVCAHCLNCDCWKAAILDTVREVE